MREATICTILGALFGGLGVYLSGLWAWSWFGDIWHQNAISSMWGVVYGGCFLLALLGVRVAPTVYAPLAMHWWHYLLAVVFFVIGTAASLCSVNT